MVRIKQCQSGRFKAEYDEYRKHTTPTSLIALLYPSFPPVYRSPLARYSFRHIYVDASQRGLYRNRDLVSFTGRELLATLSTSDSGLAKPSAVSMDMELDDAPDHGPSRRGAGRKVEEKTLDSYGFITGDLLSVSIHIPEPRTPAPAPPLGAVRPSIGAGPAGAGAPGFGGRELLGRNGPGAARGLPPREPHPSDQDGNWSRGEALPSSNFKGRGDRRDRARDDGFANGGRADVRGSGPGGPARRRTPSPHRNRDRVERRSRSPDARRSRY